MISFNNVHKSYGQKPVLKGLSFEVRSGEVYTLLGPNGAGKTTAINILCNLLDADSGNALVNESQVNEATRGQIGVAPQEISLYRDLTCRENLEFFAEIHGLRGNQLKERVESILETLRLGPWAQTLIDKLSGGWRRRMNLAVALVSSPSVLVLDEPTAGLDIESRHELWELIERLKDAGVAILLTTHLLDEAERLSHRLGIMKDGKVVAEGSMDELRSQITAQQVALVESPDPESVHRVAQQEDWPIRSYAGKLSLWLPRRIEFSQLVNRLEGVALSSLSLHEVGLEHIYVELSSGFEESPSRSIARVG